MPFELEGGASGPESHALLTQRRLTGDAGAPKLSAATLNKIKTNIEEKGGGGREVRKELDSEYGQRKSALYPRAKRTKRQKPY